MNSTRRHVRVQRLLDFRDKRRLPRRLPGVAARKTEDLLEQRLIAFQPARAHAQVVADSSLNDRLIQAVCHLGPRHMGLLLCPRVPAPF
jgi:hypothetical protein